MRKQYKICPNCNESLPRSAFQLHKGGVSDGHIKYKNCIECCKHYRLGEYSYARQHRTAIRRIRSTQKGFRITEEEILSLYKIQKGRCAICKKSQGLFGFGLAIDHDHKTNVVRGLLCGSCNVGLGHFNDSIQLLDRAKAYLLKQ